MQSKTSYRFLIIRWSGMGDVIMTLPAVKWLRNRFEACHITYLTDAPFNTIIETSQYADTVATIHRRGFTRVKSFFPALYSLFAVIWKLCLNRYDIAFDLQGFGETAMLAFLSGAPVRVGRIKESFLPKKIYTHPIRANWGRDHRTLFFLRAVAGAFDEELPVSTDRPQIQIHSGVKGPIPSQRIGLNIGASTESRRWSEQHFFQLAQRLAQRGLTIRFFLGPQETFLMDSVKAVCRDAGWEVFCRKDTVPLMQALSECAVLVSNDTGPGHLAAALNVPVVTLFSTGTPENVGPMAVDSRWFRNETNINEIPVASVESACMELIDSMKI